MAVDIAQLLAFAVKNNASDLHLSAGVPPMIRVDGDMKRVNMPALVHKEVHSMVYDIMNDKQRKAFEEFFETDFSFEIPKLARFRVNAFNQNRGAGAVFRNIPSTILSLDELNAPKTFKDLCMLPRGLVLVTGPTGSGKSTTLAGMVNHCNDNRPDHIITIEDPIEFVHESKRCLVNQREVHRDTLGFSEALRSALREDPDVVLVGEMRDLETIRLALTAAETGHLVFGTLHTSSAAKTIDRIVDVFPAAEKDMVRAMLSESLRAVISQTLMKRVGGGRIAAHEIMIGTPAIRNLIREGKIAQMYSAIQTGQGQGMQTLDQCLQELVQKGVVSREEAQLQGAEQGQHLMDREQAIRLMQDLLRRMVEKKGSDLFITAGFPPAIKVDGEIRPQSDRSLSPEQSAGLVRAIMNDRQTKEFDSTKECNFAIAPPGIGRFRVSAFVQQGFTGAVLRTINAKIPTLEELELPPILKEVVLSKRGFVILVGGTGSGKSTSLAAMVGYRNEKTRGHIVTIEDPVEYVHAHKGCVVTHREVGVDCESWHLALKNTLRQAPDVILIGEIRDRETMEYGIQFAETGHLVLATLHANSSNQALDRIINFFPEERREQLLMDLSLNIRALISQRLIPREAGSGRIAAMEIMLASPLISDLIFKGEVAKIKDVMARSNRLGMKTFDQALFELYEAGLISYEDALRNADSKNELRLRVKLESKREMKNPEEGGAALQIVEEEEGQVF